MTQDIAHSGAWGLAAIMVVLVSWILYRYLAPRTWREWASAGLVQAFVIALYAEMYGFPLTIYLLARLSGLDRAGLDASLWSTLFGIGETGMLMAMVIGYTLVAVGIGLFAEGWRQLYRARGEGRLATNGLYGLVRHPQYLGLFIALFGEGVVHWPTLFSVAVFPAIVLAYSLLARQEEKAMTKRFGEEYGVYQSCVPRLIPRLADCRQFLFNVLSGRQAASREQRY